MKTKYIITPILCLMALCSVAGHWDEPSRMVVSLNGKWKFMIGDNPDWALPKHPVTDWEDIMVPASWENQGFPGYDGYAWYRKNFTIAPEHLNSPLELHVGVIDDVDEVFVNGIKIGQKGSFPPNFWTAYNAERIYSIPADILKANQPNTIAVRVYDSQLDGGIVGGQLGIFALLNALPFDVRLDGYWKFKIGDNKEWINPAYSDAAWQKIMVPGSWEDQVSKNLDGFAWYRRQFKVGPEAAGKRYVLVLGRIDDLDEVYLNGKLVAHTGTINANGRYNSVNSEYQIDRIYYLNAGDVKPGQLNTIAVRVFDAGGEGGIYQGPVGIVELTKFVSYWRSKNKK